jgi:hypothetical protein
MFCENCGNKLDDGAKFCRGCGYSVNTDEPKNNPTKDSVKNSYQPLHEYVINENDDNNDIFKFIGNLSTIWKVVAGIVAVVILILAIILVVNIWNAVTGSVSDILDDVFSNNTRADSGSSNNNDREERASFEWVEEASIKGNYIEGSFIGNTYVPPIKIGTIIEGEVKNITDTTFSFVMIEFILYDSSGNQIGTAMDTINSLRGGNTWRFSASTLEKNIAYFEFSRINAR